MRALSPVRPACLLVVAALILSGCGGQGHGGGGSGKIPPSPDGSPVMARVGDYLITAKQVEKRIRESVGEKSFDETIKNPDVVQVALAAIVDQVVWGKAAEAAGYAKDINHRREVYLYETELLGRVYLEDTVNERTTMPSEEEIEEFYQKYLVNYTSPIRASVRHIQCRDRAKAEQALKRVLAGEDFAAVARAMSEDANTRELGGALGFVSNQEGALGIGTDRAFLSAALQLEPGQTSPVVESGQGFHVILCETREGGVAKSLDEVRDDVIRRIRGHGKISDVYNQDLVDARKKYKAEIFQESVDQYTGITDSVDRLWEVVEMQPNDRGQIEVLRRISMDFGGHELADDAQLRIAYIYACKLAEPRRAEKALGSLKTRFPKSELIPAADWLLEHLRDKEIASLSFDDLKSRRNS